MNIRKKLVAFITFMVLDGIWIGFAATSLYQNSLKFFLDISNGQLTVNWPSAVVVYILLIVGILVFPAEKAGKDYKLSIFWGFIFGLSVYGTYGFTNHALLHNWPLKITIIDTLWGGTLCALTTLSIALFAPE